MKKVSKLYVTVPLFLTSAVLLAGCPKPNSDLIMWTGFGSSYSIALQDCLDQYNAATGVVIEHESQGGYPNLQNNMNNSIATASYPDIANGYPDHFAGYINNEIQVPLDDFIKEYNEEHGVDLLSDYYPEYMKENQELAYDDEGNPITYGLPFNKSTEVLGYNNYFLQYAQKSNSSLKVPSTWTEVAAVGPGFRAVMDTLAKHGDTLGKWVYGTIDPEDANRVLPDSWETKDAVADKKGTEPEYLPEGKTLLLDCSKVDMDYFRVFSWDSADNMFITIVRQWGSEYTSFTKADMAIGHGWARFYDAANRDATKAAINYFRTVYADGTFGLPSDMSSTASYSSDSFLSNQCVFTICSSGGLSYNIKEGYGRKFRVAPIPYNTADKKFVISQGTNLAVFDRGDATAQKKAFEAIVALTTGDLQSQWAVQTGYYPASISATNGTAYQNLINNAPKNETEAAYQEAAKVNEDNYMKATEQWTKFVDPGFMGSSIIRSEVGTIMGIVFKNLVLEQQGKAYKTVDEILQESYNRLGTYVKK